MTAKAEESGATGDGGEPALTGLEFRPVPEFGVVASAAALSQAFADYFVKIAFTAESLERMARIDSVDFAASRVALVRGEAAGAALIARRGDQSRLAAMGVRAEYRRRGVGRALVGRVVADAKARGDAAVLLEVIEQNEAAVRLYDGCGFERIRRLFGYSAPADTAAPKREAPASVELQTAAAAIERFGMRDLPWQISGESIARLTPPCRAYRGDGAWLVTTDPAVSPVTIRAIVAENDDMAAVTLLRDVMASYRGCEWRAAPVWPEELGVLFVAAGFTRVGVSQWQMVRRLAGRNENSSKSGLQ